MTVATTTHDTFVIVRTYDTSAADVFRAWADPECKARWFAGAPTRWVTDTSSTSR